MVRGQSSAPVFGHLDRDLSRTRVDLGTVARATQRYFATTRWRISRSGPHETSAGAGPRPRDKLHRTVTASHAIGKAGSNGARSAGRRHEFARRPPDSPLRLLRSSLLVIDDEAEHGFACPRQQRDPVSRRMSDANAAPRRAPLSARCSSRRRRSPGPERCDGSATVAKRSSLIVARPSTAPLTSGRPDFCRSTNRPRQASTPPPIGLGAQRIPPGAIAINRATRSSVDGWVENMPRRPPPDSGFMIIICAVSGWRSAAAIGMPCA